MQRFGRLAIHWCGSGLNVYATLVTFKNRLAYLLHDSMVVFHSPIRKYGSSFARFSNS